MTTGYKVLYNNNVMNNDFDMTDNLLRLRCPKCGKGGLQRKRLSIAYVSPQETERGYLTKILCIKCSNVFDIYQKSKITNNYRYLCTPKGRILEHLWVWEGANGNILPNHVIHHLNGIKADNRLENLVAVPRSQHHGLLSPTNDEGKSHLWILVKELQKRIRELESR